MKTLTVEKEFFNIKDTLYCGQLFRFFPYGNGYRVYSADKCAFLYEEGGFSKIVCKEEDEEYFINYFDLKKDYSSVYGFAQKEEEEIIKTAARLGKGIRILNQNKEETLFSFIISQNNNIPRIKGIIERLSAALGDKKEFMGEEYFSFPSAAKMAGKDAAFFKEAGLGYRAEYVKSLADNIAAGVFDAEKVSLLSTEELKNKLLSLYGVGPKVADCALLFGYGRSECFPVDTWIEKVYRENFGGTLTDRNKISAFFSERFDKNAGYIQQYLFYYKRSLEGKEA